MNSWVFMAFRFFSLTLGRFPIVARGLKKLLVKVLVTRKKKAKSKLKRKITFTSGSIFIEDKITDSMDLSDNSSYWLASKFSSIHMGSSRYFQMDELSLPKPKEIKGTTNNYAWHSNNLKD